MLPRGHGVAARSDLGSPGFHISCFGFGSGLCCVRLSVLLPIGALIAPALQVLNVEKPQRTTAMSPYRNEVLSRPKRLKLFTFLSLRSNLQAFSSAVALQVRSSPVPDFSQSYSRADCFGGSKEVLPLDSVLFD
jgi:hypothetical protein